MVKKEYKLTKDGVKELKNELKSLKKLRPKVVESVKLARNQGDLSENADYDAARSELERVESRIKEIEHVLQNIEVIKKPKTNGKVKLGSTVILKSGREKKVFQVVGSVEANPTEGKISDESPIGKALIGKRVAEDVEIALPNGSVMYKISAIS